MSTFKRSTHEPLTFIFINCWPCDMLSFHVFIPFAGGSLGKLRAQGNSGRCEGYLCPLKPW